MAALIALKEYVEKRKCTEMVCRTPYTGTIEDLDDIDCKTHGKRYSGRISRTQTGIRCQSEDSLNSFLCIGGIQR